MNKMYKKRRKYKTPNQQSYTSKLLLIFLGGILILFGTLIGDISFSGYTLPFYLPIFFGLFLELLSIRIFVKQIKI